MTPNLFDYATKELSQDAVIAWLVACAAEPEGDLGACGQAFVRRLFRAGASDSSAPVPVISAETSKSAYHTGPGNIERVEVPKKQFKNIDVYFRARIDGQMVSFVIEDKIDSEMHGNQLARYLKQVLSDEWSEDLIKPIYFKTGYVFDNERLTACDAGYSVFDLSDLHRFLNSSVSRVKNDIVKQYREHVNEVQDDRRAALEDWDFKHDFAQWDFMSALSNEINRTRNTWHKHVPDGMDRPAGWELLSRGTNKGGTPWTQNWFCRHLFWRTDAGRPVRLMANVPEAQKIDGWTDEALRFYRDTFALARNRQGLVCGGARVKAGNETMVGSVELKEEPKKGKDALIELLASLHGEFLELSSLWSVMVNVARCDWRSGHVEDVGYKYGRLGFSAHGSRDASTWTPGVFVGILMNGWDHCTKPMDPDLGPDACVILDVDQGLHPISNHSQYQQLAADMAQLQFPGTWQFYDHLNDEWVKAERYGAHGGPNPWHPVHIRCPLAKVLAGAHTAGEKVTRFYEDAYKIVTTILDHPSLQRPWTRG